MGQFSVEISVLPWSVLSGNRQPAVDALAIGKVEAVSIPGFDLELSVADMPISVLTALCA